MILESKNPNLSPEEIQNVVQNECAHKIYSRFPFNSDYVQSLKYLELLDRKQIKDIQSLASAAPVFEKSIEINLIDLDRDGEFLGIQILTPVQMKFY